MSEHNGTATEVRQIIEQYLAPVTETFVEPGTEVEALAQSAPRA